MEDADIRTIICLDTNFVYVREVMRKTRLERVIVTNLDFMKMNEDGDLELMERTADTIRYKAYRISASEIEAVLQDHPPVIGACCVGIPDPRVGERIKAMLVLKRAWEAAN